MARQQQTDCGTPLDATPALVCRLDVFDAAQRQRYEAIRQQMAATMQQREELPDGYRWSFPTDSALLLTLAEFITLERLCCPFITFGLELEAGQGPLWLRLTGGEEVKRVLRSALATV